MKIGTYTHRCIVQKGNAAGNKTHIEVTRWNMDDICEHCGKPLADIKELIAHIYEELTQ